MMQNIHFTSESKVTVLCKFLRVSDSFILLCVQGEVLSEIQFITNNQITVWCSNILAYKACLTLYDKTTARPQSIELPGVARTRESSDVWSLIMLEEIETLQAKEVPDNFRVSRLCVCACDNFLNVQSGSCRHSAEIQHVTTFRFLCYSQQRPLGRLLRKRVPDSRRVYISECALIVPFIESLFLPVNLRMSRHLGE